MIKQQSLVFATALGGIGSNAARAGECPADKVGVDATKPVATPAIELCHKRYFDHTPGADTLVVRY